MFAKVIKSAVIRRREDENINFLKGKRKGMHYTSFIMFTNNNRDGLLKTDLLLDLYLS